MRPQWDPLTLIALQRYEQEEKGPFDWALLGTWLGLLALLAAFWFAIGVLIFEAVK